MPKPRTNVILFLLIPLTFIAPDFLAQIFSDKDTAALSGKFILGILCFGLFLSLSPRSFVFTILGLFIFLELIQFLHLFYYSHFITSSKLRLLFKDMDEVWEASKEAVTFLYLVPLLVLLPYGLLIFTFNKFEQRRYKTFWASIPVILFLAIIPYRVNQAYNGANYYPDPSDHSLRNSLYSTTNCLLNIFKPSTISKVQYQDYRVEEITNWNQHNINIILIIGEGINPDHMSLFGYKRNTNPLLSSLKNDPNFSYLKAISAGVNTTVSTPLFINGIYEPNNYKALADKKTNLFKLAKQHNFKNFYISAQSGALLTHLAAEFIDYVIFDKKAPLLFNQYKDEAFLKIIPDLDYTEKNFIVINQRNAHAPYEINYEHRPEFNYFTNDKKDYHQFMIDSYDNAMRYNDYIVYKIIDFYRHKFTGPTYIFFTSDHSEGLGKDSIHGHSFLHRHVAEIPFISYVVNDQKPLNLKEPVCHYELNLKIASLLGFKIINPNHKENICYIQGTNLLGLNDFIEINKLKQ
jgi:glucan phosphoethanolaminetransferase (alkaline phosphatase superfamily)